MFIFKTAEQTVVLLLAVFFAAAIFPSGCGTISASGDCQTLAAPPAFSFDKSEKISETRVEGRTYYVSASGDDRADGTTAQTAWRTIARVNIGKFLPDERILFRRGDVWREQLNVPMSGARDAPIVFGAYSDGNAPVIAGSNAVADWKSAGIGIYRAAFDSEPANVYLDDQPIPMSKCAAVKSLRMTKNSWFYDQAEKFLYVRLANQTAPAEHAIEAAVRDYDVYASGKSYIKIENLELKHAKQSAILAEGDNSDYWTVTNCAMRSATEAGVYARPFDRKDAPFLLGWTVENNKIGRIDGASNLDYDRAGILLRHVKNAVVRDNSVATVNKMGITIRDYFSAGGSEGGLVSGNRLTANQGNISIWMTPNAVVTGNVIFQSKGYGVGVGVRSHNALIAYNSINFLRESDDGTLFNGIDVNADSQNGRIFHNTIVNVRGFNLTLEQSDAPCNGWTVKNNIFDARSAPYYRHSNIAVDPLVTKYDFAANIYVPSRLLPNIANHFHRQDMTLAEWILATGDKNSFVADPLFVDSENNDLNLKSDSPARDRAESISGINDGKPLNIGAF